MSLGDTSMPVDRAAITCLSLQKRLVLGSKEEALQEQHRDLEKFTGFFPNAGSLILPGGCVIVKKTRIGEAEGFAAAVLGKLENSKRLVEKYLTENLCGTACNASLQDAEIVCHMYKLFGRMTPQKLKGDFTFVLYDPTQTRILAAVSPHSQVPLVQARGTDGSLIISSQQPHELPSGCHSILLIPPAHLKYGWSSDPQQYVCVQPHTPSQEPYIPSKARSFAAAKAAFALPVDHRPSASEGLEGSVSSTQTTGQGLADLEASEPQSPAPKKTRRGKRAGKNQKLRAEQLSQKRLSVELGRPSLDSNASLTPTANSFSSRADDQNWWRTATPRQSMELPSMSSSMTSGNSAPVRRSSMSAAAPVFVPGMSGLFTRQSVPAVHSRSSALAFPGRGVQTPVITSQGFVVAPQPQIPVDDYPMSSPFSGFPAETSSSGKADAAWHESSRSSSSVQQLQGGSSAKASDSSPKIAEGYDKGGTEDHADWQAATSKDLSGASQGQEDRSLPRLAVATARKAPEAAFGNSPRGHSPVGRSPEGISPGGSPHKPPRAPKNAFKEFFRGLVTKRPSQLDLWAEAGSEAASRRDWAKSSSHGNLVGLQQNATAHYEPPGSGHTSGSESSSSANIRKPNRSTKRDHSGSNRDKALGHEEALMLNRLNLADQPEGAPTTAQWLAQKTRSLFTKSKSCTDLGDVERLAVVPVAASPMEVQ